MSWDGHERRNSPITPEQLEVIAERAAEKALEKVYATVGKSVLTRLMWVVGATVIGIFGWLKAKGII